MQHWQPELVGLTLSFPRVKGRKAMRLRVLEEYRPTLVQRLKLWVMKVLFGPTALDAGRAAFYRPESFPRPDGKPCGGSGS